MTKKKVALSIDKEVLKKAKKHLPNVSEFVEECLKQYVGLADGIYPTAEAQDIIKEIGKLQAKLFILTKNFDFEESQKLIENEKLNRPFRALWNDYKRRLSMNQELTEDALKVLPVDEETLEDLLDFLYVNQEMFGDNPSWNKVYSEYQKEEVEQ